jgi:hypothetical protein
VYLVRSSDSGMVVVFFVVYSMGECVGGLGVMFLPLDFFIAEAYGYLLYIYLFYKLRTLKQTPNTPKTQLTCIKESFQSGKLDPQTPKTIV